MTAENIMCWVGFVPRLIAAICAGTIMVMLLLVCSLFMPEAISEIGDLTRDMKKFVLGGVEKSKMVD